ncbi:MAG: Polyketide cyclase/dehydrase [Flavipsychrobacter sp.]|nr:Polyketide cyclase/dehydrase [Flavipsychrobacter sp.]
MKTLLIILSFMTATTAMAQNKKATTVRKTFSRETSVSIDIKADNAIIWALLTNASDYARWNSTIISIDGKIAVGETIKLKAKLDPKRTFKLKVKEMDTNKRLVWGDAMGKRVYTLTPNPDRSVTFSMDEKIGGPMFPLFAKMIPSFDSSFDQFATDLKKESETIMNSK